MKLVTTRFKSGGLHEKHVVATWNVGNRLSAFAYRHRETELHKIYPLNADLNPTCHFLALLGAHHILHVSRIRVKLQI